MDKSLLIMGAGAGTGVLIPTMIAKHVDPKYPEGILGMKPSVIIPIATGGIGLAVAFLTHIIGNDDIKNFIISYSFPAITFGIIQQIYPSLGLNNQQMLQGGRNQRYMNVQNPYGVVSKVPSQQNIYRQPSSGISRQPSLVISS
jgi:O-antigen/teichoic acid export membrane protein